MLLVLPSYLIAELRTLQGRLPHLPLAPWHYCSGGRWVSVQHVLTSSEMGNCCSECPWSCHQHRSCLQPLQSRGSSLAVAAYLTLPSS